MQLVTYRVRVINTDGSVNDHGVATFLDTIPVKQAAKATAQTLQRSHANVLLTEISREVLP
ncbi:hypothetical protein [Stenotrophomonas phage c9-N]|nr:hypothetical protein [Stenotrophomonas phage c9-N]